MTREDAYYEWILLLCGFWDGYEAWLDRYLAEEDPLSDIVLELTDCRDIKQAEHCLRLYCMEKPFDRESVYTRLRLFLRDSYISGAMSRDEILSALFRFSQRIPACDFQNRCGTLSDYAILVDEGMVDSARFERALLKYLDDGEYFETQVFWDREPPSRFRWRPRWKGLFRRKR